MQDEFDSGMKNITQIPRMVKTLRERIDNFETTIRKPVPAAVFKATARRVAIEQKILQIAGKNPKYINCREADEILAKYRGTGG